MQRFMLQCPVKCTQNASSAVLLYNRFCVTLFEWAIKTMFAIKKMEGKEK